MNPKLKSSQLYRNCKACAWLSVLGLALVEPACAQDGSTLLTSHNLGVLTNAVKVNGVVTTTVPKQFYQFTVADSVAAVTATITRGSLTNSYVDFALVRDANGDGLEDSPPLEQAVAASNADGVLTAWLDPGVYYVLVTPDNGRSTTYELGISQSPKVGVKGNADNTLLTAEPLSFSVPASDYVGVSDPKDYYRFEVTGSVSVVTATIPRTSLSNSYVDFAIVRDANGDGLEEAPLEQGFAASNADGVLTAWLDPGVYYIVVTPDNGRNSTYQLSLSQTPEPGVKGNADNSLAGAQPLGSGQPVSDYVGVSDPKDYYRFEVTGTVAAVTATIPHASLSNSYVDFGLFRDANGDGLEDTPLAKGYAASNNDGVLTAWLDPGVYYIVVTPDNGRNTVYSLSLSQAPQPDSAGNSDNNPAQAVDLGPLTSVVVISDFVGDADPVDFYKFDVVGPDRLVHATVAHASLADNIQLQLFAGEADPSNPKLLKAASGSGQTDAQIDLSLAAGTYYVAVRQDAAQRNTPYELHLSREFTNNTATFIISEPASQTIASGNSALFTVLADGSGSLSYRWQLNGKDVPGGTAAQLSLRDLVSTPGNYTVGVTVSNAYGSIASPNVDLIVNPADLELLMDKAVIVSWPMPSSAGYVLQGAPDPAGPWSNVDRPVYQVGDRLEAAFHTADRVAYYRLRKGN